MKNIIALLLAITTLFLLSFSSDKAPTPPFEEEAMVSISEDFFVSTELVNSYKTEVIHRVFQQLKMAKGDFRSRKPYLKFVKKIPNGGRIAVAYGKLGLIYFEEEAYNVCASMAADSLNALASILGHELTHCYENHDWEDNFKQDFKLTQTDSLFKDHYIDDEIQADYLGGFLAFSAGYKPFEISEKFFKKLYEAYELTDEELQGDYPPMAERVKIAQTSDKKLKSLVDYFENANLLVAMKAYDLALNYYTAIEREFQSREIYNNMGVILFLSALDEIADTDFPYAFPIELDAESRLTDPGTRGGMEEIQETLYQAIEYFEKAKNMDAFYSIAYLNLGCAHALLAHTQDILKDLEFEEAELAAKRAIWLSKLDESGEQKQTEVNAHVLLGLIQALKKHDQLGPVFNAIEDNRKKNQTEELNKNIEKLKTFAAEGLVHIEKALSMDSKNPTAVLNKKALESVPLPIVYPPSDGTDTIEMLENKRIVQLRPKRADYRKDLILSNGVKFLVKHYDHSTLFMNQYVDKLNNKKAINFYITKDQYPNATTLGIKISDSYDTVKNKYPNLGAPTSLGKGYFVVHRYPDLLFQFDEKHQLTKWAIYRRQ